MDDGLPRRWYGHFLDLLQQDWEGAAELREASVNSQLGRWTTALTDAVVQSFADLGMLCAKGHRLDLFPERNEEYLGMDVSAFADDPSQRWQFPTAVCELENSNRDDRVAYSLWKVMCVRTDLRVVFCYRRSMDDAEPLVTKLADEVVGVLPTEERMDVRGETIVAVGARGESAMFPYGFFKAWKLEMNTGRFGRFDR